MRKMIVRNAPESIKDKVNDGTLHFVPLFPASSYLCTCITTFFISLVQLKEKKDAQKRSNNLNCIIRRRFPLHLDRNSTALRLF